MFALGAWLAIETVIPTGLWAALAVAVLPLLTVVERSEPPVTLAPDGETAGGGGNGAGDGPIDVGPPSTYTPVPSALDTIHRPPAGFFGRGAELDELRANFDRGALITSTHGEMGVGITTLARRFAQEIREDYPDGCLEIDLRGAMPNLVEPLDPVEAQRRLLWPFYPGTPLPENQRDLNKLYRKTFSEKKVLLLLDNAAGPGQLRRLVPRKPSAAIVTTPAAEFTVLGKMHPLALNGLHPAAAGEMLTRLAPRFDGAGQRMVNRMTERFGGNPMALRIAAALLHEPFDWTPRQLLQSCDKAHKRLSALRTTDRNLNVNVALELIYEALPEVMRSPLEMLAIFPAPFSKIAAAAVWGVQPTEAEKLLAKLVRSHLLNYSSELDLYTIHDLTRFYVQELLLGQPELTRSAMARYATYVMAEANLASDLYRSGGAAAEEALFRLTNIWPHLWAAWLRMGSTDPGWPRPGNVDNWLCDFPIRVMPVLNVMLPPDERLPLLEQALAAAHRLDRGIEGALLNHLGQLYTKLGDRRQALECHEQHLQLAYETHDRVGEANALKHIGLNCGALGDVERARDSWRHALALFRMMGDPQAGQIRAWLEALEKKLSQ